MSIDKHIREHKELSIGANRSEISANVSEDIGSVTGEYSGFTNNDDGSIGNHSTMSFDEGTRTFTITPIAADFNYWIKGRKYRQVGPASKIITDVDGGHFMYFDTLGTLIDDPSPPTSNLLSGVAYCCYVHWNVLQQKAVLVAEERHGNTMDWATHDRLHFGTGSVYLRDKGGLGITVGIVDGDGSLDSHSQIAVANGAFKDEDIQNNVIDGLPQDLTPILSVPVIYKTGASSLWNIDVATNFPVKSFVGGSGRAAFNEFTGGAWQQTETANNSFTLSHIFASNDIRHPIVAVQGISEYTNINAARAGASSELTTLSGIPFIEFIPIGTLILQTSNSFSNTTHSAITSTEAGEPYVDFRTFGGVTVGGAPTDHPQYALGTSTGQTVSGSMGEITGEPTGFPNRTDSTLSFIDGTRTFTISPSVSEFSFYNNGIKFTKNVPEDFIISDVEGLHFIYYDGTGVLQESLVDDHDLLFSNAYVTYIRWDSTNKKRVRFAEERHGVVQDFQSHKQAHEKQGTYITNITTELLLGDIIADASGSLDSHAQLSLSDGEINDEDIRNIILDGLPQELSPIAAIPVIYKTGANGDWRIDVATNFPVKNFVGGSGLLAYNQFTGGVWQQTEIGNNQFVLYHIWATNDLENPMIAIQGEAEYAGQSAARIGARVEMQNIVLTGLPSEEFVPIGSVIFQTSTGYTNTPLARIRTTDTALDHVDWRFIGGSRLLPFLNLT